MPARSTPSPLPRSPSPASRPARRCPATRCPASAPEVPGQEVPEARLVGEAPGWPRLDPGTVPGGGHARGRDHRACPVHPGAGQAPVLALGPLTVRPDYQRRGVGSALMHAVLGAADALGEPLIALLGDPAYYSRFGFRLAAEYDITPPRPHWAPHFQVRPLAAYHPAARGTFAYPGALRPDLMPAGDPSW